VVDEFVVQSGSKPEKTVLTWQQITEIVVLFLDPDASDRFERLKEEFK
jgi:hypothetical protein